MPVTAKLSRKFYDRFGDDIANELVDWFNAVDGTYREDLRQLNELNFARFDAKLEQRLAEFETKLEVNVERRMAHVETLLATQKSETIRWMFGFWTGTVVPLAGLILALHLL